MNDDVSSVNGYKIATRADLRNADLRGADLRYADLVHADLRGANLASADLRAADLRYANLLAADLRDANLRNADLRGATLDGAILDRCIGPNGRHATDIACRLALAGACVDAILWAWAVDQKASWRTLWEACDPSWKAWLGNGYDEAMDLL